MLKEKCRSSEETAGVSSSEVKSKQARRLNLDIDDEQLDFNICPNELQKLKLPLTFVLQNRKKCQTQHITDSHNE